MAKDEADHAAEQEEHFREEALYQARKPARLQYRGYCYNCDTPARDIFCDVECRRDYEREQELLRKQRGGS